MSRYVLDSRVELVLDSRTELVLDSQGGELVDCLQGLQICRKIELCIYEIESLEE